MLESASKLSVVCYNDVNDFSDKPSQSKFENGRQTMKNVSIFGGSEVDLRRAELGEDVTQVVAVSIFRENKIIVPPDLPVTLSGFSLIGGKEVKHPQAKEAPPASAKAWHINAVSIFGGCTVNEETE
jgi:hypothetical protein